jgi:hypothetical protein
MAFVLYQCRAKAPSAMKKPNGIYVQNKALGYQGGNSSFFPAILAKAFKRREFVRGALK